MKKVLTKEKVFKELEMLPEDDFNKVYDFVNYLRSKARFRSSNAEPNYNYKKDPILMKFIGGIDFEPFADRIDEELYG
jgi:hypothetical protein